MNKILYTILALILSTAAIIWYVKKQPTTPIDDTTLVVGTNAEYAPFSFFEGTTIVGFDIDVAREVGKRLNKEITLVDMPFDALLPKIQMGSIAMIAAGMSATPERAQKVLFTTPYFEGDPLLMISPSTAPINSLDDIKGKEIAVNEGYTADLYISSLGLDKDGTTIRRLATPAEGFLALKSGRTQAFVTAQSSVQSFLDTQKNNIFHTAILPNTTDNYSLAISKRYPDLLPQVQEALDAMKHDGTLDTLKKKWGLS